MHKSNNYANINTINHVYNPLKGMQQAYNTQHQYILAHPGSVSSSSLNPCVSNPSSSSSRIAYNWPPSGDNIAVTGSCRDRQDLSNFQLQEGKGFSIV